MIIKHKWSEIILKHENLHGNLKDFRSCPEILLCFFSAFIFFCMSSSQTLRWNLAAEANPRKVNLMINECHFPISPRTF